ncbi:MAG: hypothetical protein IJS43_05625, partial [Bacteroidaceae bacterium]|nr:hypothetical protein [Bacteroidaceae bacterium]
MGLNNILTKLFGNKSTRDMKAIQPWVEKVKSVYDEVAELDNNQLRELTKTIQQQVQSSADDIREKITALREKIEGTPIED